MCLLFKADCFIQLWDKRHWHLTVSTWQPNITHKITPSSYFVLKYMKRYCAYVCSLFWGYKLHFEIQRVHLVC